MAEIYANFVAGVVDNSPLAVGGTSLSSGGLTSLPVVVAPDYMWITLDPDASAGAPELVKVTAHSSASGTATIERGQQSTVDRQHAQGVTWRTGLTKADADKFPHRVLTTTGDTMHASAANTPARLAIGTAGQVYEVGGSGVPQWGQVGTVGIEDLAVTAAKIANDTITATQIAPNAVTSSELADNAVDTAAVADGAVTPVKTGGTASAWSPTWTNVSVGDGTVVGAYAKMGPIVEAQLRFTLGASSSVSGAIQFTLPVNCDTARGVVLGIARMSDTGTDTYTGQVVALAAGTAQLQLLDASGAVLDDDPTSGTAPFAWGSTDFLDINLHYLA